MYDSRSQGVIFMHTIYSEKIDKEVHNELNGMGKKLAPVFGIEFPKVNFKKTKIKNKKFDEKRVQDLMMALYCKKMPKIKVYLNTTPFSTWNVEKKYLSISNNREGDRLFAAICHEANHFMYDYCFKTKKYEETEIKEILTVLHNYFGIYDSGWKKFSKKRKKLYFSLL